MAKAWAIQFYNSKAWKSARHIALQRDGYTCLHCDGRAEEVHHIVELTPNNINDINISLDPDNLMSLCRACHNKVTKGAGDLMQEYIFDDDGNVVKA